MAPLQQFLGPYMICIPYLQQASSAFPELQDFVLGEAGHVVGEAVVVRENRPHGDEWGRHLDARAHTPGVRAQHFDRRLGSGGCRGGDAAVAVGRASGGGCGSDAAR